MGVAFGIQVGNFIYFCVSAMGLGAILATSEVAFLTIKYAGAAYLVYIGVRTIVNARENSEQRKPERLPLWRRSFVQGLVNQLGNPKSILFYGALFPQFVDYHSSHLALELSILFATGAIIEMPILAIYSATAARGGKLLPGGRLGLWRERVSGAVLIAVGSALSLVKRAV
jgi:homoserine/homoserine lactone efflux protein